MYKKLLGLLPLVWIVALAPNLVGLARSGQAVSTKPAIRRPAPSIAMHQCTFYRSKPSVLPLAVLSYGRTIQYVSVDGSTSGLSHLPVGQKMDYNVIAQTSPGCTLVLLSAASAFRLPLGRQLMRVGFTDGAFVDFTLTVAEKCPPGGPAPLVFNRCSSSPRRPVTGILASNKTVLGGNNERRVLGPGTRRAVATL